jgi:hypothetical protein
MLELRRDLTSSKLQKCGQLSVPGIPNLRSLQCVLSLSILYNFGAHSVTIHYK